MAPSSIQVSTETRERLRRYKVEGMSYETVVRMLMDVLPPEEFHRRYQAWQDDLIKKVRKGGKWVPLEDLDQYIRPPRRKKK